MSLEIEDLVIEAVKIANVREHETYGDYEVEVAREAVNLKRMLSKGSTAMRALSAIPLIVKVTGIEFEKSSNRYLISFVDIRSGTGEVEHIRSDRLDGPAGEAVKKLWDGLVGKNVRLYKYLEPTSDPMKPSVRIAPYVELL